MGEYMFALYMHSSMLGIKVKHVILQRDNTCVLPA